MVTVWDINNIETNLRGPTQNFSQKLQKNNCVEKASSGMGEMRPKILGATSSRTTLIGIDPGFHQFRKKLLLFFCF